MMTRRDFSLTRRDFSLLSLAILMLIGIGIIQTIHMSLPRQILLFTISILLYTLSLILFHKYKIKKIIKSFSTPKLWETVREIYDLIEKSFGKKLESVTFHFNAIKGSFFVHESLFVFGKEEECSKSRIEFILYFTYDIPVLDKDKKISGAKYSGDEYKYRIIETCDDKIAYSVDVRIIGQLEPVQINQLENILDQHRENLLEIFKYSQKMKIVI